MDAARVPRRKEKPVRSKKPGSTSERSSAVLPLKNSDRCTRSYAARGSSHSTVTSTWDRPVSAKLSRNLWPTMPWPIRTIFMLFILQWPGAPLGETGCAPNLPKQGSMAPHPPQTTRAWVGTTKRWASMPTTRLGSAIVSGGFHGTPWQHYRGIRHVAAISMPTLAPWAEKCGNPSRTKTGVAEAVFSRLGAKTHQCGAMHFPNMGNLRRLNLRRSSLQTVVF